LNKESFRETMNIRIMDPAARSRWITWIYTVFTLVMLLHHVYVTIYFPFPENGAIPLRFVWVFWAGVTIVLGRMWKDKCFWILTALLLMKFLRIAIPTPELLSETQTVYEICIYAFYICYGTGRVLGGEDRKRFISLFCALWTLAMVVYACIGLYTAFTGIEVPNLGNRPFTLPANEKRLWPVYHPVEAGTLAALSIAVALIGFFMTKRKVLRWLYFPAMFAIFLLNVFCASRTSYILSAMAIGIVSAMLLYETLQQWKKQGKGFKLLRLGVSFAAFAALTFLLIFVQMRAIPVFNSLKSQDLISTAAAEEGRPVEADASEMADSVEESVEVDDSLLGTRTFVSDEGIDGFLTGRWQIWIHCCSGISHYPIYALIGAGVYDPMEHINTFIRYGLALPYIYHFHSTFIQTLWESGIPGFLLFTVFFGIFLWNAFLLFRNRKLSFWQRLIPLPAFLCWLADMVDVAGYCNYGKPPMTLLYLFAGLSIALAHENKKGAKQS